MKNEPRHLFTFFLSFAFLLLLLLFYSQLLSAFAHSMEESQTLMAIRRILNYPPPLAYWNYTTDFCNNTDDFSTSSFSVVCYEYAVTQLHIFGEDDPPPPPLPADFSMPALFTELANLPTLKVLSLVSLGLWGPLPPCIARLSSLEILNMSSNFIDGAIPLQISHLTNMQTFNLDHNRLSGPFPLYLARLPQLSVLSLRNNSLSGSLPTSISNLENLRILSLSSNKISGEVPDLRRLANLQVVDLGSNSFGPHFPLLSSRLLVLLLGKNMFRSGIPAELSSFFQLQKLDISCNRFVGQFPPSLLSMTSLTHLDVSNNELTGMLQRNMSCNQELAFVNMSSNMLRGELPKCLLLLLQRASSAKRVVDYYGNCLGDRGQAQRGVSSCENQALAAEIPRRMEKRKRTTMEGKVVVAFGVVGGGIAAVIVLSGTVLLGSRGLRRRKKGGNSQKTMVITDKITSGWYPVKLLSDAGHMCQTMKLGPLGLPSYRPFSIEELKEATGNFDASLIFRRHSDHVVYRGDLGDGSAVAVRSAKTENSRRAMQAYTGWVETVSRVRNRHLVSVLGHCFESDTKDASRLRSVHLVFEYASHTSLRDRLSGELPGQRLSWSQRIAAAVGVIKGIQFLHSGIFSGVFRSEIKITDIRLDPNLHVKICCYNLPLLQVGSGRREDDGRGREEGGDRNGVHDIGVILLEVVTGVAMVSEMDLSFGKDMLAKGVAGDEAARREAVDPEIRAEASDESLRAVMEICSACLSGSPGDRPSADDVLWHMHFAAQVQGGGEPHTSGGRTD